MTRRSLRSALLVLAMLVAGCSEGMVGTTTPPPPPPTPPSGMVVTGPGPFLVSDAPASTGAGVRGAASLGDVGSAWVSLRPGTLPGFTSVTLRVQRTGVETVKALQHGGLDPVAIDAVRGDTVILRVGGGSGPVPPALVFTIPERTPPVIVRTVPPVGKRDVPLNFMMQVVFSEPVANDAIQGGAIMLLQGGTPVPGQLRFGNPARTVVEFEPGELLAPLTTYQLVVGTQVRDLDGVPLAGASTIEFVTANSPGAPPLPLPPLDPSERTTVGEFAFVRDDQIYLATAQGVTQLTNTPAGYRNRSPAWSPDGSRIAFVSTRAEPPCPVGWLCTGRESVYVMNTDGSNVIRLTSGNAAYAPAWAPDGLSLVYESGSEGFSIGRTSIFRISAAGGTPTLLLERQAGVSSPSISPDGLSLAVSINSNPRAAESWWGSAFDLYRMSLAPGASPVLVLAGPDTGRIIHFFRGKWSPDGQWIAMSACGDEFAICYAGHQLTLVRADGTGYVTLTGMADGQFGPSWSPDGTKIAFTGAGGCIGFNDCIKVIAATGGTPEVILHNAREAAWRP